MGLKTEIKHKRENIWTDRIQLIRVRKSKLIFEWHQTRDRFYRPDFYGKVTAKKIQVKNLKTEALKDISMNAVQME